MDEQVVKLRKELLTMCWYMRGGITYDEAVFLCQADRQSISEIISDNFPIKSKNFKKIYSGKSTNDLANSDRYKVSLYLRLFD